MCETKGRALERKNLALGDMSLAGDLQIELVVREEMRLTTTTSTTARDCVGIRDGFGAGLRG